MMNSIAIFSRRLLMPAIVLILLAGAGCKSKKKAMEAAAIEKARMEQEASQRQRDEERKKREQEEADAAERDRKEREARAELEQEPYARLDQFFNAIAGSANSPSANSSIQEALSLFATEDTPVLIVISDSNGVKDYDRPTTIKAYLNYLKDVKQNVNRINKLHFDASKKIVEVELIKAK